ncbi:MAG TPA: SRPBCC family protein [Mesorhizobium sp.]|uniref:SRPBCC family protein n=1 Tax=Mesorhizobium sp. TaxID=1871066 RepID=UPI002DDD62D7|nr:SRPBCC family protein [Mesorhizobium sp.]HEV2503165.1 SRPBCC family protein [Mesorhizobium sp.]
MPYTIRLHRVLKAPPEKVYRAFLDAEAMCRWLPPYGFLCSAEHFDARVGGTFRMAFRNYTTGHVHSFGGEFLELEPNRKLVYTDRFNDPNLPGEIKVTVNLTEVFCGTDLKVEQAGIPDLIPEAGCYLGWQESLLQLANVVEPNIP